MFTNPSIGLQTIYLTHIQQYEISILFIWYFRKSWQLVYILYTHFFTAMFPRWNYIYID